MRVELSVTFGTKALLREFLQHLRTFEGEHFKEMHMTIGVEAPDLGVDEMEAILRSLDPPLPNVMTFPGPGGHA